MHHCKNCAADFQGNYCSSCGQKASVHRLHLHDIWHELWHAFTHTDKGILKLLKDLVMQPASMYRRYFAGQRKRYFSPVLFYVLTAGIAIYAGDQVFQYEDQVNQMNNEFGKFVLDHTKLLGLFLLPVEALLTWAFFRRQYNLAECAVFWLFANGLVFTLQFVLTPIYFLFINHKSVLDYSIRLAGFMILFWQLSAVFAWKRNWINYVTCFVLINLIMVLYQYAGFYLIFDKEAFHQSFLEMLRETYIYEGR